MFMIVRNDVKKSNTANCRPDNWFRFSS